MKYDNDIDSIKIDIPDFPKLDTEFLNKHTNRKEEFLRPRGSIFENEENPPKFIHYPKGKEISEQEFWQQLKDIENIKPFSF